MTISSKGRKHIEDLNSIKEAVPFPSAPLISSIKVSCKYYASVSTIKPFHRSEESSEILSNSIRV